jgi:hypothetical protein
VIPRHLAFENKKEISSYHFAANACVRRTGKAGTKTEPGLSRIASTLVLCPESFIINFSFIESKKIFDVLNGINHHKKYWPCKEAPDNPYPEEKIPQSGL